MTTPEPLSSIITAYATASAGMHPSHTLPRKLDAIAAAGFAHAEIAFPDLEAHAASLFPELKGGYKKLDQAGRGDVEKLEQAARDVAAQCARLDMRVLALMPFSEFEGYEDAVKKQESLDRAQAWFRVLKALGCDMLQVGSTDDAATTSDPDLLAADLRRLADAAAQENPPVRIAYEPWAWGVHANTWQQTWALVSRVARPNFGICLDTFQISARAYANPTAATHLLPDADNALCASLDELTRTFSDPAVRAKIFYLQISDGSRAVSPSALRHAAADSPNATTGQPGIHPLYAWSDAWRPLPREGFPAGAAAEDDKGGFLPVLDVCAAVLRTGWRGPWSYEVFFAKDMSQEDPDVPARWARDAQRCHGRLLELLRERGFE